MEIKFNYGDKVKDTVTDVEAVVTAFAHYYGKETDSYLVDYKSSSGSLNRDWISENRLELVERSVNTQHGGGRL